MPVACHVAFYCTDTCNINVVTGEEHEAVLVQVRHSLKALKSNCICVYLYVTLYRGGQVLSRGSTASSRPLVCRQASWLEGKEECNPLFTFRQLDAELGELLFHSPVYIAPNIQVTIIKQFL